VGAHGAARAQAKSKSRIQKYEELVAEDTGEKVMEQEITIPPPPRARQRRRDREGIEEGVRRQELFDDLTSRCRAAGSSA
jgi:hypothetical protein